MNNPYYARPPEPFLNAPPSSAQKQLNQKAFQNPDPGAPKEQTDDEVFQELLAKYAVAICTSQELKSLDIPERTILMGGWMREGDLGFVFGPRGAGKTWFVDAIATHLSTGRELFEWSVPQAEHVLFVDGEMPLDATRDRLKGMMPKNSRLHLLHHERLFDLAGETMNLTSERIQRILTELCTRNAIKLLILDNLSCLFSGMKENDADEWEKVLNWLLDLRRRRIAVLIVHHSGVSGRMRGTTRREDAAFWVIRVDEVKDREETETGARFETNFEKQRNSASREWTREWTFKTEPDGQISIGCKEISLDEKVFQLIKDGINTNNQIADELEAKKYTISRCTKRLEARKLIESRGSGRSKTYEVRGALNETKNNNAE